MSSMARWTTSPFRTRAVVAEARKQGRQIVGRDHAFGIGVGHEGEGAGALGRQAFRGHPDRLEPARRIEGQDGIALGGRDAHGSFRIAKLVEDGRGQDLTGLGRGKGRIGEGDELDRRIGADVAVGIGRRLGRRVDVAVG